MGQGGGGVREERARKSKAFVEAYKNSEADVEVIPSYSDTGDDLEKEELVAAYCRVSTMSEQQVESYELQKIYYEEFVSRRPNWTLVGIYPDEGISATSMRNRKKFNEMIQDCKDAKITLIITKSVARFARNVVDAISTVRMLRNLPVPVAVYADVQKEPEDSSSDSNQSKENEGVAEEPFADSEAATSQTVEDTPVCNKSICDIDVSLNVSNDMAPQGEERPSAEENHLDLRGVFDPEEEISFLFDDNPAPSDEAPAPEEAEDFELIDAAIVSDAGYFAVTYDANSNSGTFAFALETQGDRRFHESTVEECKNIEQATFEGAAALLEEIKNSGYTSIIIHMDKESCALLRRNAIYGIVDEYSESCIKYIQKPKKLY